MSLADIQVAISENLKYSKGLAIFINLQMELAQKRLQGRRYTRAFKHECLALYFSAPKLYKNTLRQKFCLPGKSTLLKEINGLDIEPGFNNMNFLNLLATKMKNFSEDDRICVLCIDEMSIKSHLFYAKNLDRIIGFEDDGLNERQLESVKTATTFLLRGLKNK
ncbi:hypothetical protein ABEB36_014951 [Hypothenemus hampei]